MIERKVGDKRPDGLFTPLPRPDYYGLNPDPSRYATIAGRVTSLVVAVGALAAAVVVVHQQIGTWPLTIETLASHPPAGPRNSN